MRHPLAALSFAFIALNLLFWCVPLLFLSVIKRLLPNGRRALRQPMEAIYRLAVHANDWWFGRVLGVHWQLPALQLDRDQNYLVIANHCSWMDIFVVQSVLARNGPVVKFLTKRQLVWIPVIGLVVWAFDFPLLKRQRKSGDRGRVRESCDVLREAPGAMLSFVEGTRFTLEKHAAKPGFEHLLPPKPGGFSAMCDAITDAAIVDITLVYPETSHFWAILGGGVAAPVICAQVMPAPDTEDATRWLEERWRAKDALIGEIRG